MISCRMNKTNGWVLKGVAFTSLINTKNSMMLDIQKIIFKLLLYKIHSYIMLKCIKENTSVGGNIKEYCLDNY